MQSVFIGKKTGTQVDGVLAVFFCERINALVHVRQLFYRDMRTEQIRLQCVGLKLGKEDARAAVQRTRVEERVEARTNGVHDRLGKGSRFVERDLHAVKMKVLC